MPFLLNAVKRWLNASYLSWLKHHVTLFTQSLAGASTRREALGEESRFPFSARGESKVRNSSRSLSCKGVTTFRMTSACEGARSCS